MIHNNIQNKIYYYTDFNTFKLILENGTLRFKESTASNDLKDTKRLYERIPTAIENSLNGILPIEPAKKVLKNFAESGKLKNTWVSLVACFSTIPDSRLLWDAYTMHRKDRLAKTYNGVCLEIDTMALENTMNQFVTFDYKAIKPILYGDEIADKLILSLLDKFYYKVEELKNDKDQHQKLVPMIRVNRGNTNEYIEPKKCLVEPLFQLLDDFAIISPFCKHNFWREEQEVRALLAVKKVSNNKQIMYKDLGNKHGYHYFDLPITKNCISKVILGPEFPKKVHNQLISANFKIRFNELVTVPSEGTGIITNN